MGIQRRHFGEKGQRCEDLPPFFSFSPKWSSYLSQRLHRRGQHWITRQCALLQRKPIQLQGKRASLQKELRPCRQKLSLKTSSTLTPTQDSLLEVSLAVQTQWTRCRRGARTGWSPTSTPPPMPTLRCSPPSAGLPPLPTSKQRLLGRSQARQRWRRLLHT